MFKSMKQSGQATHILALWSPVLAQMALIFFFSAQPAGTPVLQRFPFTAEIGHFGGYALLSLLFYRALAGGLGRWSARAAGGAVLCAVLYGFSDELHQYFVPGREPSWADLLVDGAGAAAAVGACRLLIYFREKFARTKAAHRCAAVAENGANGEAGKHYSGQGEDGNPNFRRSSF